ncbi:hypothetical protein RN001_011430 [Aquatica leii]|uniref:MICOS complex subunit MIC60 n=1 Tax=Aquatica leii TaxID=1421715 RepID=A0AAN7SM07_9COLE|nr:hypothetical protein RN001_011430 [Aquatica leii]
MYRIVVSKVSRNAWKKKYYKCYQQYRYATNSKICPPPKSTNYGAYYTLGVFTIVGCGTIGYARYDSEFRDWLNEKVPYSDDFIKFLFQEDRTYFESFTELLDTIKKKFFAKFFAPTRQKDIPEQPKKYTPPAPAFTTLASASKDEEKYNEIRLEQKFEGRKEPVVTIEGDIKPKETFLEPTHPKKIVEIEQRLAEAASETIQAYNKAVYALKNYNNDIQVVVENSVEQLDPDIWESLRIKTKAKEESLQAADKLAKRTEKRMKALEDILDDPKLCAPETIIQQAMFNIDKVRLDLQTAKKEFDAARKESNLTDKYWKKVEEARNHFIEEIQILFPGVKVSDRKMTLQGEELDLFILHAFSNVLFYQKELFKLQVVEQQKVKLALENARRGNQEILSDAQINQLVEKQRKCLEIEFQKKCLALRAESERELRRQLKLQSEAFADHLYDALLSKEKEMHRDFARTLDEKVMTEKCKFKLQVSALAGRLKGMDQAFKERAESDRIMRQSQILWSACQNLFKALKAGCPGLPWTEQLRPLEPEIVAVKNAAAENDELVKTILGGISQIALERGVFPEDALRERFLKVEEVARQLALLPVGGGRLPLHILSYIHSLLLVKAATPIPQAELDDEAVDFTDFSINDILQRARYWVDRGDFTQCLRYMNLLDGASRCAALQWMEETRLLLETQQATNILLAHAAASGLMFL